MLTFNVHALLRLIVLDIFPNLILTLRLKVELHNNDFIKLKIHFVCSLLVIISISGSKLLLIEFPKYLNFSTTSIFFPYIVICISGWEDFEIISIQVHIIINEIWERTEHTFVAVHVLGLLVWSSYHYTSQQLLDNFNFICMDNIFRNSTCLTRLKAFCSLLSTYILFLLVSAFLK